MPMISRLRVSFVSLRHICGSLIGGDTPLQIRNPAADLLVFTGQLIIIFGLLALGLFQTPIRDQILRGIMGLPPELAAYCEPAMSVSFVMAAFWSCTALFRGFLARARTTRSLAASGVLRIATAALAGMVSFVYPQVNGALLGISAWVLSYAVETGISSWRLIKLGWFVEQDK